MYVIIVGCGRVGAELAKLLSNEGHDVVIIDKNPQAFNRLGGTFNGVTRVGSGFNPDLLKECQYISHNNMKFKIPKNVEEYLDVIYLDWRTPTIREKCKDKKEYCGHRSCSEVLDDRE